MLYKNVRDVVDVLHLNANEYAKRFLKSIFDQVKYVKGFILQADVTFDDSAYSEKKCLPNDPDPDNVFRTARVFFDVFVDCLGKVTIIFADEVDKNCNEFRILEEVLVGDGFVSEENKNTYTKFI